MNAVLHGTVEARVFVNIVRVVRANLGSFVRGLEEAGKRRVGEFHMHLQCDAQQSGQIAIAFCPRCGVGRGFGTQNLLAAALEVIAELRPGFAAEQLFIDALGIHDLAFFVYRALPGGGYVRWMKEERGALQRLATPQFIQLL